MWTKDWYLNSSYRTREWILALKNTALGILLPKAVIRYVILEYLLVMCVDDVCDFVKSPVQKDTALDRLYKNIYWQNINVHF